VHVLAASISTCFAPLARSLISSRLSRRPRDANPRRVFRTDPAPTPPLGTFRSRAEGGGRPSIAVRRHCARLPPPAFLPTAARSSVRSPLRSSRLPAGVLVPFLDPRGGYFRGCFGRNLTFLQGFNCGVLHANRGSICADIFSASVVALPVSVFFTSSCKQPILYVCMCALSFLCKV
jgi:hypothetical protein